MAGKVCGSTERVPASEAGSAMASKSQVSQGKSGLANLPRLRQAHSFCFFDPLAQSMVWKGDRVLDLYDK